MFFVNDTILPNRIFIRNTFCEVIVEQSFSVFKTVVEKYIGDDNSLTYIGRFKSLIIKNMNLNIEIQYYEYLLEVLSSKFEI